MTFQILIISIVCTMAKYRHLFYLLAYPLTSVNMSVTRIDSTSYSAKSLILQESLPFFVVICWHEKQIICKYNTSDHQSF